MSSETWLEEAIAKAVRRTRGIAGEVSDFPHITEKGKWIETRDGVWTGGFWAGLLWLAYERERDQAMREKAEHFTERLLPRANDSHNHDLGFMFMPSAVKGWQLTGEERYRDAAIAAAEALARQYSTVYRAIPGWGFFGGEDWTGRVLIDTLMNLPLLVWAVEQGADRTLLDVARNHAATTLEHHFRPDGSVYHVFWFDPRSGAPVRGDTYQGVGPESSWTRGQAWAITGLAMLAARLHDKTYQAASEKVAANFAARLPADFIPPWDFDAPGPDQPKDASAGAAAAYGLLKLRAITGKAQHLALAGRLLRSLAARCGNGREPGGLLLHATADLPHGLGIDESTMYGDYYYLKSLAAFRRQDA